MGLSTEERLGLIEQRLISAEEAIKRIGDASREHALTIGRLDRERQTHEVLIKSNIQTVQHIHGTVDRLEKTIRELDERSSTQREQMEQRLREMIQRIQAHVSERLDELCDSTKRINEALHGLHVVHVKDQGSIGRQALMLWSMSVLAVLGWLAALYRPVFVAAFHHITGSQ